MKTVVLVINIETQEVQGVFNDITSAMEYRDSRHNFGKLTYKTYIVQ